MPEILGNYELTIEESQPVSYRFLEEYQDQAYEQIAWDGAQGGTIRGLQPRDYMLKGLLEELNEMCIDEDRSEPAYSRFGALLLMDGNERTQPGIATPTSVERHLKEFGDVSWYLSNYLTLHGIRYDKVIPAGLLAWKLDRISQPRCSEDFSLELEKKMPWIKLVSSVDELQKAAQAVSGVPRDERIQPEKQLVIASGKCVTSMIHVARTRFGVDYQAILEGNRAKLEKRMLNGTLFDKTGGDDR